MNEAAPRVERAAFGALPDGRPVERFTLRAGPVEAQVVTWGAIVTSLRTPDRDGHVDDVVLGHDDLAGYLEDTSYLGAVVGRYGNRIARGRFTLDGREHQLTTNDGVNHLHGGARGFDRRLWRAEPATDGAARVTLRLTSEDGDEGYPGRLEAAVTYTLDARGTLAVEYRATTDRATPVNLTQHTYWNLAGAAASTILEHELSVAADRYVPVDETLIPTGALADVAGTPFDFRTPTAIGARIADAHPQLRIARGYDHTLVLSDAPTALRDVARLADPRTGRTLVVRTTEPGIQLYSGNFLDGTTRGRRGRVHAFRGGLCLETQHFPNAPNEPGFPSTILRPGEAYGSRTEFVFGVEG